MRVCTTEYTGTASRSNKIVKDSFLDMTWPNSLSKGRNCLSNSLLAEPDTAIKDKNLNGQVPQTLDAIICQISAPQAANPISFLRVACPPVVQTLHSYLYFAQSICDISSKWRHSWQWRHQLKFVTPLS